MTNVTMKALDTLNISSVKADNILTDEEFEVSLGVARSLRDRKLAEPVNGDLPGDEAEETTDADPPAPKAPVSITPTPRRKKAQ